jgi:hypothetical protein
MAGIAGKLVPLCVVVILVVMGYLSFAPASEKEAAVGEGAPEIVEPAMTNTELELAEGEGDNFDIFMGPALLPYDNDIGVTDTDSDGDGLTDETELDLDLDPFDWDSDGDLLGDGAELGDACGSTSPHIKDSDNDGLEDPWEDNDGDGILNLEEDLISGTNPNDNDTDGDGIADDLEFQTLGPGPINGNSKKYFKYTQIFVGSDNDGPDDRNASGPDGRPGIAWHDDDGDGEIGSPTNYYDVNGDGSYTFMKMDRFGHYIYEKNEVTRIYEKVQVDIPTFDPVDSNPADNIPLITGTVKLADGKDNDFNDEADDGIDEADEIAYSADGAPGKLGIDDDDDSKDSDSDGFCDGQERFQNSDPFDATDVPCYRDANGNWVPGIPEPFSNYIDEGDEYGYPGTDDYSDDSADDDGLVDDPNFCYDRYNPALDISVVGSPVDEATEGALRWFVPYLWRASQFYEQGHGGLPVNSTCIPLTHWNPALLILFDIDIYGDPLYERGGPYRWNHYDTDPTSDDTDTDGMEDNWDPRPTLPDDRLDTLAVINYFKNTETAQVHEPQFGEGNQRLIWWENGPAIDPGVHDGFGFPHIIKDIAFEKGAKYEMSIFVGLEWTPPNSPPTKRGWFRPFNITIGWHNMSFGQDQMHYTSDDDFDGDGIPFSDDAPTGTWDYDPENANMPLITLSKNDLVADNVPADLGLENYDLSASPWGGNYEGHSGLDVPFGNHSWTGGSFWSKMTFYELKFFFYIPEGCPVGMMFIDIQGTADENIFYEDTPGTELYSDYPMMYN